MLPKEFARTAAVEGFVEVPKADAGEVERAIRQSHYMDPIIVWKDETVSFYTFDIPTEIVEAEIRNYLKLFRDDAVAGIRFSLAGDGEAGKREYRIAAVGPGGQRSSESFPGEGTYSEKHLDGLRRALRTHTFDRFATRARAEIAESLLPDVEATIDDAAGGVSEASALRTHLHNIISADASNQIRDAVETARERYPSLDLRFGYIGNLERWGDDRSWSVTVVAQDGGPRSEKFGGVSTERLTALLEAVNSPKFDDFCQRIIKQREGMTRRHRTA